MEAGKAAHEALAAWLRGEDWTEALSPYAEFSDQHNLLEDRRSHGNLTNVLSEVFHRHPVARLPFVVENSSLIEVDFAYPLGTVTVNGVVVGVNLIGVVDGVVRDRLSGKLMAVEHKTTGQLSTTFLEKFHYEPQTTAYLWAIQKVTGEPIDEIWVNAIELQKVPSSDRRCSKHGTPYVECGPLHVKQAFIRVSRTPDQLAEFERNALRVARDAVKVGLFVERHGDLGPTKTPRYGPFTGACEWCDYRKWCITANRQLGLMNSLMEKHVNTEEDNDRLRSGFTG